MFNLKKLSLIALVSALGACNESSPAAAQDPASPSGATATHLSLTVDGTGYHPGSLEAPANQPVHLSVTRTSDEGCGDELVFPSLNIRRELPLGKKIELDLTMPSSGSLAFGCGMGMLRGKIIAK